MHALATWIAAFLALLSGSFVPDSQSAALPTVPPSFHAPITSTIATSTTIFQQPIAKTIIRTYSSPIPDDLVHEDDLTHRLANIEAKLSAQISALKQSSTPYPEQVAAGGTFATGNPYLSGLVLGISQAQSAAANNTGGGSTLASAITGTITNAIHSALGTIDSLFTTDLVAVNSTVTNATTSNIVVTGSATIGTSTGVLLTNAGVVSSLTNGTNGQVLKIVGGSLVWGTDLQGSGGGSSAWATTSDSLAVYTSDATQVVLIGTAATTTTGNILEVKGNTLLRGSATTQGVHSASIFTSTSTTATSTLPFAQITALKLGTDYLPSFSAPFYAYFHGTTTDALSQGSANKYYATALFATDLAATTTAALAEGTNLYFTNPRATASFIANLAATTSVASIATLPSLALPATQLTGFGIPFYQSLSATTTDALGEGATNKYYSDPRVLAYLNTLDKGYFFSTTSADAWKLVNNFFATSSADYWRSVTNLFSTTSASFFLSQNQGAAFSTSSASYFLAQNADSAFSTSSANYLISAYDKGFFYSTTSANAWLTTKSTSNLGEGTNLYFTSARADARINATSTLATLTSTPSLTTIGASLTGFLKATAGALSTALVDLSSNVSGILPVTNGGTGWAAIASGTIPFGSGSGAIATTTPATPGQVLSFLGGLPTWTATTTFSSGLAYNAGNVINTGVTSNVAGSGISVSGATGAVTINFAAPSASALSIPYASTTMISAATASSTAIINSSVRSALVLNGASGLEGAYAGTSCTNQFVRSLNGSGVATCAPVSLTSDISGILGIGNGGTNATALASHLVLAFDGARIVATSTPTAAIYLATSTTLASFFPYASTTAITATTASTTNLFISGVGSSLLKVSAGGQVTAAIPGTDYIASTFAYLFPNNSTSTALTFSVGLMSLGSTTIGAGAQATGLTISGGATTTGTAYFAGNVGIGNATSSVAIFAISKNVATLPSPTFSSGNATGTVQIGEADGRPASIFLDSFGSVSQLAFRRSNNTAASGTATVLNDNLGQLGWFGFGASGYASTARTAINARAAENWSDTAQGTVLTFSTTPTGSTASTERMRLDGNGNLGIGTTSPWSTLSVTSNNYPTAVIAGSSGSAIAVRIQNDFYSAGNQWDLGNDSLGGLTISHNGTDTFYSGRGGTTNNVFAVGNVGIGTTSPFSTLSVNGNGVITGNMVVGAAGAAGTAVALNAGGYNNTKLVSIYYDTTSDAGLIQAALSGTANKNLLLNPNGGNVGIGTTTPVYPLSVAGNAQLYAANPIIDFNSANSLWRLQSVNGAQFRILESGTGERLTIAPGGNVGIGSTSPSYALDVNGDVNIATGRCFRVNGVCIGYTVKLVAIYASSTVGSNSSIVFTGAQGSQPSFAGGTLTMPRNISSMSVELWGAGGGAGGYGGSGGYGGAGGGGGYAQKLFTSLATSYAFTIGAGGTGGTSGNPGVVGGSTCFASGATGCNAAGTIATSTGGSPGLGGSGANSGIPGAGGLGVGGDINLQGGSGSGINNTNTGGCAPRGSCGVTDSGGGGGNGGGGFTVGRTNSGSTGGAGGTGGIVITVYATSSPNAAGNDYAEMFPVSDPGINAGDIVSVAPGVPVSMRLAGAGDSALAGVISTQPGQVLGEINATGMRPVALSGRVPVKISLENGPIKIGDRIAPSSVPGVGKKAAAFDNSVGIALENYDGTQSSGTITVFLDLQQGLDINALALTLLGNDTSLFAANDNATNTAVTSSQLDFVGGMMRAFGLRIGSLTLFETSSSATTTDATSTPSSTNRFAADFMHEIFSNFTQWLADSSNGIQNFFAEIGNFHRVNTAELCVKKSDGSDLCVTGDQLGILLGQATITAITNPSPSETQSGHASATTVPEDATSSPIENTVESTPEFMEPANDNLAPTSSLGATGS